MFKSTRHVVYATRTVQDANLTALLDDDGVVLGEWRTPDIERLEWRTPGSGSSQVAPGQMIEEPSITSDGTRFAVGSVEWRADVKTRHPKAYAAWGADEDDQLREEHTRGDSVTQMSRAHQRQPGGIRARLVKLGLVEGPSFGRWQ